MTPALRRLSLLLLISLILLCLAFIVVDERLSYQADSIAEGLGFEEGL